MDAATLWKADKAEAYRIGNCGELSAVAFKFLLRHTHAKDVAVLGVGDDHALVVIGASREQLEAAKSKGGTFELDKRPRLPKGTVFCDPWAGESFPASDWPDKIKPILRETQTSTNELPMDDDERQMFERAGLSTKIRDFSEDWKEIDVYVAASKRDSTVREYQAYRNQSPVVSATGQPVPVQIDRSGPDPMAQTPKGASQPVSPSRVYDERARGQSVSL